MGAVSGETEREREGMTPGGMLRDAVATDADYAGIGTLRIKSRRSTCQGRNLAETASELQRMFLYGLVVCEPNFIQAYIEGSHRAVGPCRYGMIVTGFVSVFSAWDLCGCESR